MSVIHSAIIQMCQDFNLRTIGSEYGSHCQKAAEKQQNYHEFLHDLLDLERQARLMRSRHMITQTAGFPAIKNLDSFDFKFAHGVPKKQVMELSSLSFIERGENVVRAKWCWKNAPCYCPRVFSGPEEYENSICDSGRFNDST